MKNFVKLSKEEMKMILGGTEELEDGNIDECRYSTGCTQGCAKGKYCSTCCIG